MIRNQRVSLQRTVMLFRIPEWMLFVLSFCLARIFPLHWHVRANEVVGPLVGTVEATTAHLLYRPSGEEQKLQLTVLSESGSVVSIVESLADESTDYVAKFTVNSLTPATTYRYQIDALGSPTRTLIAPGPKHRFTTASPAREGHCVTVGFVSCVDIEPNGIWNEMESLGVNTLCLMGDTPYIDNSDLNVVRQRHRMFLQMPDLASLATHTPTIGVWDDHDFGRNNGNGLNMMSGKPNTRRGFVDYRAHTQYGNGREGVYHKVDLGMIEVFLLDPRYFSQTEPSPVDPAETTCFGADQWTWLLSGLKASEAPFKVIALGSVWQDKKNREIDDMFTYWYERDALLDFVAEEQISGVTLLGGDIHVSRHLVHPQRVGYNLHDFVISPGHTRTITELDVYHPSLEWSLVEGWQFLTLTADGTGEEPHVIAEYRQTDGKVNRRVELRLSEMTPRELPQGLQNSLRANWHFDDGFENDSILGNRIDAVSHHGAAIFAEGGIRGGAVRLHRDQQQSVTVQRSFLDDNSDAHTVSLWFKPESLPGAESTDRHFLLESTAEGHPSPKTAWHLSLGLRAAAADEGKVNLQLHTVTLRPAQSQMAPTALAQGPFDFLIDREQLLDCWTHVLFTFDSKQINLYIDGKRAASNQLPVSGPAAEFGGLVIGGHRDAVGRNFDGWVDEVAVWERALSQQEIESVFTQHNEPASGSQHSREKKLDND